MRQLFCEKTNTDGHDPLVIINEHTIRDSDWLLLGVVWILSLKDDSNSY